jgi:hypothetical protein
MIHGVNHVIKTQKKKMDKLHTFSGALAYISAGKLAYRAAWVNKVIFMRPPDDIPLGVVIDDIKSLPKAVKDYLDLAHDGERSHEDGSTISVQFSKYLCMIDENKNIINGWQPTQKDMLSDDWVLV